MQVVAQAPQAVRGKAVVVAAHTTQEQVVQVGQAV
jgi:hypothetical protein